MKIVSRLSLVALSIIFLTSLAQLVNAADSQIAFRSDSDWSSWVKRDVELVSVDGGSDLGLRLAKIATSKYELTGAAVYKISLDGLGTWGDMTSDTTTPASSRVDFSFSSSEISINQSFADLRARADVKTDPKEVGASDSLYIRVDLFADSTGSAGAATPILKSLTLKYTVAKTPSVYVEKHIYRYLASDPTPRLETATFLPGMMASVKIKLSATNAANMKFKAQDYLPRLAEMVTPVTGIADAAKYCGLKTSDTLLNNTYVYAAGADSVIFDAIDLDNVSGYLCYTYYIPSPPPPSTDPQSQWQAKNDVQQVRLNVTVNDVILATSSNYLMVRGFAYSQSDSSKTLTSLLQIDDELLFSFDNFIFKGLAGKDVSYTSAPTYTYKRGIAAKSRGGDLYDLPVTITDTSGSAVLSSDSYYLLYNPSVYVMGNLFSKNSLPDSSLDFGTKNNVVSGFNFDSQSKINAQASLYNYSIDSSSVAYWNSDPTKPKSQAMKTNIDRIVGTPDKRPENFCDATANIGLLADGNSLYLNNNSCNITSAETSNNWPEGRVWYFKPTGDVSLAATIKKSGTMVFDFTAAPNANVRISTVLSDFSSDANVGIILTNGGNVVFTKTAEAFNGMVFVPGTN